MTVISQDKTAFTHGSANSPNFSTAESPTAKSTQPINPVQTQITPRARTHNILEQNYGAPTNLKEINILMVHREGNAGDANQCLGIASALKDKVAAPGISFCENTLKYSEPSTPTNTPADTATEKDISILIKTQIAKLTADAKHASAVVVIASGTNSDVFAQLQSCTQQFAGPKASVFSSHMLPQSLRQSPLPNSNILPDIIAVPRSATRLQPELTMNYLRDNTSLVLSRGVPHNVNAKTLVTDTDTYNALDKAPIPTITSNTVAIVLPGDAPNEQGEIQRFTPTEAEALAERIFHQEVINNDRETCHFIVTNGPRTGKHDDQGKELTPNPHKAGNIDASTQAFLEKLNSLSCADKTHETTLFDFQFSDLPSAYKPILASFQQAGNNRGAFYVAGESTSMVDEVTGLLPEAIIIETHAMNNTHRAFTDDVLEEGAASFLRLDESYQASPKTTDMPSVAKAHPTPSDTSPIQGAMVAAERIADAIVQQLGA